MIFETFDDVVVAVSAPIDMSLQCDSSLFSSTQFKVTKYIFETYVLWPYPLYETEDFLAKACLVHCLLDSETSIIYNL